MTQLQTGDRAPEFTVDTAEGPLSLRDLLDQSDKGVIVYFYPKAMTPGCTTEACDFRDANLSDAGYSVIGISPDPVEALERFTQAESLTFPLGSDPDHEVMEAYGAWGEKKNYGRVVVGVIRSTFVIDKDGTIVDALYNVKATGHVARVTKNIIG
ncbi:thioredoxin-dependent thiol peroxidase [Flaviflexus equikiangi]|uniref:thioredoxin-dependent peroxiredoxin n=1 Tax=Flaviflexus equikiangi TaxID=2758573 RepID=A0ABS2TE00_9ACTO|nr:thioredoxin-dependent thiol peroxidase [Flaviflexus equikiangi]MBM9432891.1 thioredoxin-dependent thiol peroxidase [Flaviflexus equikiangi]